MYTTRTHRLALEAAAAVLEQPRTGPAAFHYVVSGRCGGLPVEFRLLDWGWRVTVRDAPSHVAFDVRDATSARDDEPSLVEDPQFRVGHVVDGAPADTVRAALSPELRHRIADLELARVELSGGVLTASKTCVWSLGGRGQIEVGIQLAVDIARAVRTAPIPEARIEPHTGGSPYRGSFAYSDPDKTLRAERAAYDARLRRRRRRRLARRVGWAAAVGALFVVWPIGVVVWGLHVRRRDQRRDRRLAAARAELPAPEQS